MRKRGGSLPQNKATARGSKSKRSVKRVDVFSRLVDSAHMYKLSEGHK